jgi:nicotinamidase-related amidase
MPEGTDTYVLLVIDMQNDFVLPGAVACVSGAHQAIPAIQEALALFRQEKWPVFFAVREHRRDGSDVERFRRRQFLEKTYALPGTPGCEIVPQLQPLASEYRIVKRRFSAFMNTELDLLLRRLKVNHIVVCGTRYPTCVRTTVFDAVAYDYEVTVLTDATSARTRGVARANLRDMKEIGVHCLTVTEFKKKDWII